MSKLITNDAKKEDEEIVELINEITNTKKTKIFGKNFKQMSREEIVYLLTMKDIALKKGITFAKHALDRMEERYIKERDVIKALKNGQLIDYRWVNHTDIITIRGSHINKYGEQVYVIFSLNKRKVITTYTNKYDDAYRKMMHLDRYKDDFKIYIPKYFKKRLSYNML